MGSLMGIIGEKGFNEIRLKVTMERFISADGITANIKNTPYPTGELDVQLEDGRKIFFTLEQITAEEIQKYGKSSCDNCYGRGRVRIKQKSPNLGEGVKVENSVIMDGRGDVVLSEDGFSEEVCSCALNKFSKTDRGQDVFKDMYKDWCKISSFRIENPDQEPLINSK